MLNRIIEQKLGTEINYMEIVRDWLRKTKIGNREDMITAVLISSNIGDRKQAEQLVDDVLNNKKEN